LDRWLWETVSLALNFGIAALSESFVGWFEDPAWRNCMRNATLESSFKASVKQNDKRDVGLGSFNEIYKP